MVQSNGELGLTEELAATPIHVDGEMWSLLEAARYLRNAHTEDNPNRKQALGLSVELARLRREAQAVEDTELLGAADALEKSAREVWSETP